MTDNFYSRMFRTTPRCKVRLLRDGVGDTREKSFNTTLEEEVEDDGVSLIYSVRNSPTRNVVGEHGGIKFERKSRIETSEQRVASSLPENAPGTDSNISKKKQAAARLLKSSIRHALLNMQQPRKADYDPTADDPQAHGDNGEELKKLEDELLQAVDDCLMLV